MPDYTVLMDFDPIFYEAGFAGQKKQYLVEDSEGVIIHDLRIEKKGPKKFEIKDMLSKFVLDTVYTRKEAVAAIGQIFPNEQGFTIEEYLHVSDLDVCKTIIDGHIKRIIQDIRQCPKLEVGELSIIPVISYSSEDNYRKDLATLKKYKGNRDNLEKPVHFKALKEYVTEKYNPFIIRGMEADDFIAQVCWGDYLEKWKNHAPLKYIAATIDKDFNSFPGIKWFWRKAEAAKGQDDERDTSKCLINVSHLEAFRYFYSQMITGDTSDNIGGCQGTKEKPGPGPAKANKALKDCATVLEMYLEVAKFYCDKYTPGWRDKFSNVEAAWWTPVDYIDWQGDKKSLSVLEIMVENGRLLWLQHLDGDEIHLWSQKTMEDLEAYFNGER